MQTAWRTRKQLVVLAVTPIITGTISFFASSTLIITILRSNLKLSTVYRRLIMGMSVFDLVQSLGQAISSIPMPMGSVPFAIGNDTTCNMLGFVSTLGMAGSLSYNLCLGVYFLLKIKYQIPERTIKTKVEPYLHGISILFTITGGILNYVFDTYNPSGLTCIIALTPVNCLVDPDIECEENAMITILSYVFIAFPLFLCMVGNIIILALIWLADYRQTKKNEAYRSGWSSLNFSMEDSNLNASRTISTGVLSSRQSTERSCRRGNSSRLSRAALLRRRAITRRSIAYIIGSILTYIFAVIFRFQIGYGDAYPSFVIELLRAIFLPLQGFFNIIIFTGPHVASYRQKHVKHCWFRAFVEVVKSGGDSDQTRGSRNSTLFDGRMKKRRNSVRKEPIVLDIENIVKKNIQEDSTKCATKKGEQSNDVLALQKKAPLNKENSYEGGATSPESINCIENNCIDETKTPIFERRNKGPMSELINSNANTCMDKAKESNVNIK